MNAPMLLHDSFFAHADAPDAAQRPFLVEGGVAHSYREVARHARAIAAALRELGLQRGERAVLFMDNSAAMVAALYGVLAAGGVFVPVNPLTKRDKLAFILDHCRARVLIADANLAEVWKAASATCHAPCTVIVHGAAPPDTDALALPAASDAAHLESGNIDQDLAALIYTSGSTAAPKGVMLSHLNMLTARRSVAAYLGLRASDRIFCALPLSFDYGLYQVLMAAQVGACVLLEPSFAFPVKCLEVMAAQRASVFPGVPTMFSMLMGLSNLDRFDLSGLRLVTNTAAALTTRHIEAITAMFPQAALFSMYGLTECKRVTYLPPEQLATRPASVGRGMPNQEVWLVDDDGRRLPNGSTGELVIRGSHVMRGYWNDPQETARRLRPGPLPGEWVLYSGDLFRTDDEGWLYFVARRDDIIKSRGEKVSPREVENAIHSLAGVRDVAVVGVEDELLGEAIKAFVVPAEGAALSEKAVIRHCMGRLESFMVPKHVEFVCELPTTDTGKIRKASLSRRA